MPAGVAAFLYLAGLWLAAPVVDRGIACVADRLRAMLVVGIAIPVALGAAHVLYAAGVWAGLAILVAGGGFMVRQAHHDTGPASNIGVYAVLAATLVVVWPALVRPLLDGDSLAYHLPNAVSWVQMHSIYASTAPYWYYPPASELFASGLFAASGRWSLPLAGILPAWLVCARLYTVAREAGAPAYAAAAVPLAFICTPLAAFQSGTLQNDLWLAAFFVEALAAARQRTLSLAVCALLKPFGWIEAAIAAAAARISWRVFAIALVPLALWIVRDAVILTIGNAPPFGPQPAYWPSTIAGNLTLGIPQLIHGTLNVTPQCFVWAAPIVAGFFFPLTRRFAAAGALAFALYVLLPVSYSNGLTNYVLDASSLRYALPAFACGALVAAILAARAPAVAAACGYAVAVWGAYDVLAVFWNDSYTRYAPEIAALAIVAALSMRQTRAVAPVALWLAILVAGAHGAASRAGGFYADWMRDAAGKSTGAFAWIAQNRPARVVAYNVRPGAVLMSSPQTQTLENHSGDGCALARSDDALLFVGSNEDTSGAGLQRAFAAARACGGVLYADGAAVIVRPSP